MTVLGSLRELCASDAVVAMARGEHVSNGTRKLVAGALVVAFVGVVLFVWWLKSDREDD